MRASENIKKLRLSLGLEQSEFAQEVGVSTGTVCNWEKERRTPRLPKIRKMVELAKRNKLKFVLEDFLT
jgi:DNA-binding transcriptional regulator YiaG